jgi:phosphoribosylamine--glycine ligase
MKIALHGHMGRDGAAVDNLLRHGHQISAVGSWENPNVIDAVTASGGQFDRVAKINDAEAVADFVQAVKPDLFYTHFDDSLAGGTVDAIQRRVAQGLMRPVLLASPNRESARIEWDKFFLREMLQKVAPEYNPDHNFMVTDRQGALDAIAFFEREGIQLVIKPRNPTGGKGVKVMGKHLTSYEEARDYAQEVLADPRQHGLEIQERMDVDKEGNLIGHEFTLQLLTDGNTIVLAPATYDYPYREDGDEGPGTGGMGTFS